MTLADQPTSGGPAIDHAAKDQDAGHHAAAHHSPTYYPDLTSAAAASIESLLPLSRNQIAGPLHRSRLRPLAASPDAQACEPAHFVYELAAAPVPTLTLYADDTSASPRGAVHEMGVGELLAAYRSGSSTPTETLALLRQRWRDPHLAGGAVLAEIDCDDAAALSTQRWRDGNPRALEGVFFGVKDIIDVAGSPVTAGSKTTGDRIAQHDATVITRLRAHGAIPALITATTEFACGAPDNARYGHVTNPWRRDRWTGGSSTGSAGALAAGLVPLALGTDTGGSIRVPSALCNLTGIKPTYGLVPRTGVASLSWTLDHVGPMARSAADLDIVLAVLAGPDHHDPTAAPESVTTAVREGLSAHGTPRSPALGALRIGVPSRWFTDICDTPLRRAWEATIEVLRTLGAQAVPLELPDAALNHDNFTIVMLTELAANQEAARDRFGSFDIGTQVRIAQGTVPSAVDYLRALRRRSVALRDTLSACDAAGVDVILTPGVVGLAPRLADATMEIDGQSHPMQALIGRTTGIFDYLGLPAVMTPAGFADGLPIGVQIVGRPWADAVTLRVARVLQSVTDYHQQRAYA